MEPQAKSNQEIDLTFKLKSLQQSLEQEEVEHKATRAKLPDKNTIDQSIEEAIAEAVRGESPAPRRRGGLLTRSRPMAEAQPERSLTSTTMQLV